MTPGQYKWPTRSRFSVLRPLGNLIPTHLVSKLAPDTSVADEARTFSPWSHVASMIVSKWTVE